MAGRIRHNKVATGVNDATKQVSKDGWNEDHVIEESGGAALTIGAIAANQFLQRVGTVIQGGAAPGAPTRETPVGAINGANKAYTVTNAPTLLMLFLNGLLQTEPGDYALVGNAITYVNAPQAGDSHSAVYW